MYNGRYVNKFDYFINRDNENINEGLFKALHRTTKFERTLKKEIKNFMDELIPKRTEFENDLINLKKDKNATDEDYLKVVCEYFDSDDGILSDDLLTTAAQKSFTNEDTKELCDIIVDLMMRSRHAMSIQYSYKGSFEASIKSNAFLNRIRKQLAKADSSEEKYRIIEDWYNNDLCPFYRESISDILTKAIDEYVKKYTDTSEKVITDIDIYMNTNEKIDWNKIKKESDDTVNNVNAKHIDTMKKYYGYQQENIAKANQLFDKYISPFFEELVYKHVIDDAKKNNKKIGEGEPLAFRLYTFYVPGVVKFYNVLSNRERVYSFIKNGGDVYDLLPRNNEVVCDEDYDYIMDADFDYHYKQDLERKIIKLDDDLSLSEFDCIQIQPIYLQPTIDWCNENGIKFNTHIGERYVWGNFNIIIDNDTINDFKNQR